MAPRRQYQMRTLGRYLPVAPSQNSNNPTATDNQEQTTTDGLITSGRVSMELSLRSTSLNWFIFGLCSFAFFLSLTFVLALRI
jgi:hypothetical protein